MTWSQTVGSLHQSKVSKSTVILFNDLGIYRFCIAFAAVDFLDIMDFLDFAQFNLIIKYSYAAVLIGFMAIYFLRWRKTDVTIAPLIFLLFFIATGLSFAVNFFAYYERNSYISAFISPLVFCLTIFIPPNSLMLDARKIVRVLTILFSAGAVFYLIEAAVKWLGLGIGIASLDEVQILKSMSCLLALCLCILTGRKILALLVAVVTVAAFMLRPVSTLVLALAFCLPIAIALRRRVTGLRPVPVLLSRVIAMTALLLAVSIPWLLYFYFDDVGAVINSVESYLKTDVFGAQSNIAFRLAILKYAFSTFDTTSLWYGTALAGNQTVSLALIPGWDWWFFLNRAGEATIHSDFVIVMVLTGLIGYTLLSVAFYLVLRNLFRDLSRVYLPPSAVALQALSIIAVVALLVFISDEPYLGYYNHAHSIWMLLLISEVVRKSKVIDSASTRVQNKS